MIAPVLLDRRKRGAQRSCGITALELHRWVFCRGQSLQRGEGGAWSVNVALLLVVFLSGCFFFFFEKYDFNITPSPMKPSQGNNNNKTPSP